MQDSTPSILSVSQLTQAIKLCLENSFCHVWLQGEVSNLTKHTSGHLYFSIKDSGAQIAAVMFRKEAAGIKFPLTEGAKVIVRGDLNVYPSSGRYQIVVRELRLVGLGELLLQLEELKKKLHARGWFDAARKQDIPRFPKRIGIVTSPTGAAIQDILNVLQRRFSGFNLLLNPVRVQGLGAATEIAQAICDFNRYQLVDVMIIGRGGGSIEDLWAFNEEIVAEAIFNSRIPIISAVGHETDVCLSDYVADARAPTPSAAAAMVIAEKEQQLDFLLQMQRRIGLAMRTRFNQERQKMAHIMKLPAFCSTYGLMGIWMQRADDLRAQIDLSMQRKLHYVNMRLQSAKDRQMALQPSARIQHIRARVSEWENSISLRVIQLIKTRQVGIEQLAEKQHFIWQAQQNRRRQLFAAPHMYKILDATWVRRIQLYCERNGSIGTRLQAMHPKNLLEKGYAIIFDKQIGSAISSLNSLTEGLRVRVQLADGEFETNLCQLTLKESACTTKRKQKGDF